MNQWLALGTALVLGFVHALELDHMVAVTAFVSRRPAWAAALGFGLRWGIGHSFAVLAAGGALLALGVRWSSRLDAWAEITVGAMLVGVGFWSLRATHNLHLHPPAQHGDHAHVHVHPGATPAHDHPHGAERHTPYHHPRGMTAVGLVHGLAGTSAVVALVPITLIDRATVGIAYLIVFGIGVTAGMTLFALVAAAALRRAAERSLTVARQVARGAGFASVAVGLWWVVRALSG